MDLPVLWFVLLGALLAGYAVLDGFDFGVGILSPLVGGLPATGAIARTATNIRSGARTPVAGMVHALTLLLIVLIAARS